MTCPPGLWGRWRVDVYEVVSGAQQMRPNGQEARPSRPPLTALPPHLDPVPFVPTALTPHPLAGGRAEAGAEVAGVARLGHQDRLD